MTTIKKSLHDINQKRLTFLPGVVIFTIAKCYSHQNGGPTRVRGFSAQKMKFSSKDLFSKRDQVPAVSCGFGHIYWRIP